MKKLKKYFIVLHLGICLSMASISLHTFGMEKNEPFLLLPEIRALIATKRLKVLLDEYEDSGGSCFNAIIALIQSGANPNVQSFKGGSTVLHHAVTTLDSKIIKFVDFLCAHGANPNIQNNRGEAALYVCIKNIAEPTEEAHTLLNLLFQAKADPSIFCDNKDKRTVLHELAWNGTKSQILLINLHKFDLKMIENICIAPGVNVNAQDNNGNTPAHVVASGGNNANFLRILAKFGADFNIVNKDGKTPLAVALNKRDVHRIGIIDCEEIVKILQEYDKHK